MSQPDPQQFLQQIGKLSQVTWELRDHLLAQGGMMPEVARLEEAAHLLERSLAQLAATLHVELNEAGLPTIKPRSPL